MSEIQEIDPSPVPSPEKGGRRLVVGVDVGGTKIAAAVVDGEGRLLGRVQRPTEVGDAERTLASIADAVRLAVGAAGLTLAEVDAVGLGIPGQVDPVAGIGQMSVNLGWRDAPVRAYLESELGVRCAIENDVSVAALGESHVGVGRGLPSLVYLIMGTGIAARVVIDGRLYRGVNGLAGEIGHLVFDPDGPLCKCGARGCLEAIASGPGIAARAREGVQAGRVSALGEGLARTGTVRAHDVFAAADAGDAWAAEVLAQTGRYLGQAVAILLTLFDPAVVVLGGGLAHSGPRLLAGIHAELARQAEQLPALRAQYHRDKVVVSPLRDDAALLGAAALVQTTTRG